ncbi:NUDIX domain-containing protein [Flexivirga caeni]|uniref:NUDIX domain-containing protein n=1 Tax=Flexivirga caeni TaxID=2294115 RepID=UPI0013151157|nr:NUDIX domain-containing protein [Flexivirga caeni]
MPVSPHIARLRAKVGHDLLVLPSVAVLPVDEAGRVLLVRQTDFGTFGTVGGAIDEDESPADAACREAREETGLDVELTGLVGAIGGPEFRMTYPNGDQVAYVSIVYMARIIGDAMITPDGDEVDAAQWFAREELCAPAVSAFALSTFRAIGWIDERVV